MSKILNLRKFVVKGRFLLALLPKFPTRNYTSNNGYKRGRVSSNGGRVSNNGNGGQHESDSLNEVLDGE